MLILESSGFQLCPCLCFPLLCPQASETRPTAPLQLDIQNLPVPSKEAKFLTIPARFVLIDPCHQLVNILILQLAEGLHHCFENTGSSPHWPRVMYYFFCNWYHTGEHLVCAASHGFVFDLCLCSSSLISTIIVVLCALWSLPQFLLKIPPQR